MTQAGGSANAGGSGMFAPLKEPTFRRIWSASLLSNFGQLILGVGAAWEMTRLSNSPSMVALVQTAMMIPLMLVALPAGALADMFDRRKIALIGLAFSILSSGALTAMAYFDMLTPDNPLAPWVLLGFCMLIGAGVALYAPSWQASISEQVSSEHLPAAVALGTISYNVARSFGPALGGLIVLAAGAKAAFAINATFYFPLWIAFLFWRRSSSSSRLPPERIDRAIVSGARYALHAPQVRTVLGRAFLFGLASASGSALAPLIARDLLHGNADVFGIILGASGIGAVVGALFVGYLRETLSTENSVKLAAIIAGAGMIGVSLSQSLMLTCIALFFVGAFTTLTVALLNVGVQLSAPRWVTARALSLYSSALTGGIAFGAVLWGLVATRYGTAFAMSVSGACVVASALLGLVMPLPRDNGSETESVDIGHEPEVALALTMRSGPVIIEVEYHVDPENARTFYDIMLKVQKIRQRNGGFDWSLSRDIADPAIWTEHYHCPTWGDYLRMRDRYTQSDLDLQNSADAFNTHGEGRRVRRRLERPFGSVRWKADSPDPQMGTVGYIGP